jgi:hypothetical protein
MGEPVVHNAFSITFSAFKLAGKTAGTSLIVQIVEMDQFRFRPLGFRSIKCMFEQRCGVPFLSRASVDGYDVHGEIPSHAFVMEFTAT